MSVRDETASLGYPALRMILAISHLDDSLSCLGLHAIVTWSLAPLPTPTRTTTAALS